VLDFQLHLSSTASLINTLVRMVLPLLRFNSRLGGWLPFLWVGDHCEFVHHDQHGILDVIAEPDLLLTFGIRYGRLFDADRWNVGIAITLTTDVAPMHSRSIVQFHDLSSSSPLCKDINECWLFHCTSSDICLYAWQAPHHVSIQRISFFHDHRVSGSAGMYGIGMIRIIHFASQSRKSHQHTCPATCFFGTARTCDICGDCRETLCAFDMGSPNMSCARGCLSRPCSVTK